MGKLFLSKEDLKRARLALNMTRQQMGRLLGRSEIRYSQLETGKREILDVEIEQFRFKILDELKRKKKEIIDTIEHFT
jgi:transcriptional regulator with XRE-family HTH domain